MEQGALVLDFPARDQAERIRREVASILREHVGAHRALPREKIATHVKARLGLNQMTRETVLRRVRECRHPLVAEGMRIVSGRKGWYLAETAEEVCEGSRLLRRNALDALREAAHFDRVTVADYLRLLGQGILEGVE